MRRVSVDVVRRHPWLTAEVLVAGVALVVFVLAYFAPQQLLVETTAHETLPAAAPGEARSGPDGSAAGATAPTVLRRGRFRSGEHHTSGTALLLHVADGRVFVRLEHLDTSNGPDVHIWLTAAEHDASDDTVQHSRHVDLGVLKANHGDQNYLVPAHRDLSAYRTVTVWCQRFDVAFGAARLRAV
jgi:Electron transfer DM13